MSNPTFFHFSEHSLQDASDPIQMSEVIVEPEVMVPPDDDQRAKYLGVRQEGRFFKADYFIGLRWVPWKSEDNALHQGVIQTRPKRCSGIPFMKLLLRCLSDEIVSQHLGECYRLFPDEPLIPFPLNDKDYITPLIICEFLVRVKKIIKKGIKRDFKTHKEVLSNNIKGRIDVNESLRLNITRISIPRISCSYQTNSLNCLENRILKTTLLKIDSYCKSMNISEPEMQNLLAYALYGFQEINPIDVSVCDFTRLYGSSFFKEYKPTLELARILLKTFSYPVHSEEGTQIRYSIPFYINMPELFERYCEVLLRAQYSNVKAGYQLVGHSETRCGKSVAIRPDFLLPEENIIVDSKYKYWGEFVRKEGVSKEDIGQLSLYARHEKVLEKLGNHSSPPNIQFVYPKNTGEHTINFSYSANEKVKEIVGCYKYPIRIIGEDI